MRVVRAVVVVICCVVVLCGDLQSAGSLLSKRYSSITLGRKERLTTLLPETLNWRSTDSTIVSVSNAVIRARRYGSASIIAWRPSGAVYDTCQVTVVPWAAGISTMGVDPVLENLNLVAMRNDTLYLKGSGLNYRWRSVYYYSEGMGTPRLLTDFPSDGTFPTDAEQVLPTSFGVFILAKRESQNAMRKIYRTLPGVPGATLVYDKYPPAPNVPNLSYTLQQGWDYDQQGNVFLGEYNVQSATNYSIRLFKGSNQGLSWSDVYTFPARSIGGLDGGIRHVHACQVDPYDGRVWVATGDENAQSRIYYSDTKLEPGSDGVVRPTLLAAGLQDFRTVSFAFTQGFIYWFMDAGCDSQKIFRIPRAASYPAMTPATMAAIDYRQLVGTFKDKPFYNNITIREGSTSTILVETVFEDVVRYHCSTLEQDRRNRIFAIREHADGTVETQEVLSAPAQVVYARMTPIGQDSRGDIYFNSSYCGDSTGVQIYRGRLHWNDVDNVVVPAAATQMSFSNSRIALEGTFTPGRNILVSRFHQRPDLPSLPSGVLSVIPAYWQVSGDADPFFTGRISIPRSELTDVGASDSLIWLARTDPGGAWVSLGGTTQNGSLVSEALCTGYYEFTVASSAYQITATAGAGGSISPAGTITAPYHSRPAFTVTPQSGFRLQALTVDGVAVDSVTGYTFTDVTADHQITASFAAASYAIDASATPHATITPSGRTVVAPGASLAFAVTISPGYHLDTLLVDGTRTDSTASYTFSNIQADHTIRAVASIDRYVVVTDSSQVLRPTGSITVDQGTTLTFNLVAPPGRVVQGVLVDGVRVDSTTSYTFYNISQNHTLYAVCAVQTFSIQAEAGMHGAVDPAGVVVVPYGSTQRILLTPDEGYHVGQVLVDGLEVDSVLGYTFSDISGDHTLQAQFAVTQYSVAVTAGLHGTVTPSGVVGLSEGDQQVFRFFPDPGYHVSAVLVDGVTVDSLQQYSFTNIAADHTLDVTFARTSFIITSVVSDDGTVTPAGDVTVFSGDTLRCVFTPEAGHHVASVTVDGAAVDSTEGYTFSNVMSAHTLHVAFADNAYPIEATAGPHGTITPAGLVDVPYGGGELFSVVPDAGYRIDSVIVDGVYAGRGSVYEFTDVTAGHSIRAVFTAIQYFVPEMQMKDDFNGPALATIAGQRRWVAFTQNETGGTIMQNGDSTISASNPVLLARGGAAWDSLLTDGTRVGIVVRQKGLNSAAISSVYLYFRMNGTDLRFSNGYCLLYVERPTQTDIIYLMRATTANSLTMLTSMQREIAAGDTLIVKVEADRTMKALVYGANRVRDSISYVDNTYSPAQWYCWIRGVVLPTPVKLDNFMIGPTTPVMQAIARQTVSEVRPAPAGYQLAQNYPNPFNPVTEFRYGLPVESRVRLKIFNLLGQEIATLVDDVQAEGYKSVRWDASTFSSGVYFFRLEAWSLLNADEKFEETRSMVLIK